MTLRFGSVCSGIEAASVAWNPIGWSAAWLSEIEAFPSALLSHRYPKTPNLGDMTELPRRILSGEIEAPDLLCGGTPCQSFSVAGQRGSLNDDRGNLTLIFCEIANAIDSARLSKSQKPSIIFWENVPGVLNTKDNAFGCLLGGLAGEDCELQPAGKRWENAGLVLGPKRAVAWRVLDAQYFGVAQRRRRVFVIASARDGFNPAEILFEFDGLRRDIAPSREAEQDAARDAGNSFTPSSFGGYADGVGTLRAAGGDLGGGSETLVTVSQKQSYASFSPEDLASTIAARDHKSATDLVAYGCTPTRLNEIANTITASYGQGGVDLETKPLVMTGRGVTAIADDVTPKCQDDIAFTLSATDHKCPQAIAFNSRQDPVSGDVFGALDAGSPQAQAIAVLGGQHPNAAIGVDLCPTLTEAMGTGGGHDGVMLANMTVRRLTPVECERLQGFPDNYTAIPWRNKPAEDCPDGHRYKALGNSWAVPVVAWIGRRIQQSLNKTKGLVQ